ncbi:unnamed protein product [Protopolystoma xenopodis]|uniref:Secreted protein n=1 Tax=Protopolystoma xenopodis TaxID=117903 RepID=A0A448WRL7_9PLAT|nr:unnamed protein product [Protopolystoma xenopodis]
MTFAGPIICPLLCLAHVVALRRQESGHWQEYSTVRECLSHPPVLDESFHHLPGSVFIKSAELVVTNRILIRPRWPSLQRPEQTAEAREHVKHNHSRLPHTFNSLHVCLGMGSSTLGSYQALLLS